MIDEKELRRNWSTQTKTGSLMSHMWCDLCSPTQSLGSFLLFDSCHWCIRATEQDHLCIWHLFCPSSPPLSPPFYSSHYWRNQLYSDVAWQHLMLTPAKILLTFSPWASLPLPDHVRYLQMSQSGHTNIRNGRKLTPGSKPWPMGDKR